MCNKIVNINHIITKFGTVVSYTSIIICTNFGKKLPTFAEVTLKIEWTKVSGPEHGLRHPLFKRSMVTMYVLYLTTSITTEIIVPSVVSYE